MEIFKVGDKVKYINPKIYSNKVFTIYNIQKAGAGLHESENENGLMGYALISELRHLTKEEAVKMMLEKREIG